jgi:ketosteroid isomerase-like protein
MKLAAAILVLSAAPALAVELPPDLVKAVQVEQPVEKMWGNVAVIGGLVHLSWTQDGKHQTRLLRVAYVWAKRNGHWQATYTQVTSVPRAAAPGR